VVCDGFPLKLFIVVALITKEIFKQLLIHRQVENKVLWVLQFPDDNWDTWHQLMWYTWVPVKIIISKKVNKKLARVGTIVDREKY